MSNILPSEFDEVVVRLTPTLLSIAGESQARHATMPQSEATHSYDVLIYTDVPDIVRLLASGQEASDVDEPDTVVDGSKLRAQGSKAQSLAGLPLAGVERVVVRWNRYQEYLDLFRIGAKDPNHFSHTMFETLSGALEVLFNPRPSAHRPLRIWWSSQTPELDDLPWELVAHANPESYLAPPNSRVFFVRGLPPNVVAPLLPVGKVLRLAVIGDKDDIPSGLWSALHTLSPHIEFTLINTIETPLRQALQQACSEGYELAHVVAAGSVSLSYEGFLDVSASGETGEQTPLGARELSSILSSSRIQVLSLSVPVSVSLINKMPGAERSSSETYRAFAYLGGSQELLPSVVACLGPMEDWQTIGFWSGFYKCLGESLAIDEAIAGGLGATPGILEPVALFLRHTYATLFRARPHEVAGTGTGVSGSATSISASDPAVINAQLQASSDTIARLTSLRTQFSELPPSVEKYLEAEQARHSELEAEIAPWINLEEGEAR